MSTEPINTPKRFMFGTMPTQKAYYNGRPVHAPARNPNVEPYEITQDIQFFGCEAQVLSKRGDKEVAVKDTVYDFTSNDFGLVNLASSAYDTDAKRKDYMGNSIYYNKFIFNLRDRLLEMSLAEKTKILNMMLANNMINRPWVDGSDKSTCNEMNPRLLREMFSTIDSSAISNQYYIDRFYDRCINYCAIFSKMSKEEVETCQITDATSGEQSPIYNPYSNETAEFGLESCTCAEIVDVASLTMAICWSSAIFIEAGSVERMFSNPENGKEFTTSLGCMLPAEFNTYGRARDIIDMGARVDNANCVYPGYVNGVISTNAASKLYEDSPSSTAYNTYAPTDVPGRTIINILANVRDVDIYNAEKKSFDIASINIGAGHQIAISFNNASFGDKEKATYNLGLKLFSRILPYDPFYTPKVVYYSNGPLEDWVMLRPLDPNTKYNYYIWNYSDGSIKREYVKSAFWEQLGWSILGFIVEVFTTPKWYNPLSWLGFGIKKVVAAIKKEPYIVSSLHVAMGDGATLQKRLEIAFGTKCGAWVRKMDVTSFYAMYTAINGALANRASWLNTTMSVASFLTSCGLSFLCGSFVGVAGTAASIVTGVGDAVSDRNDFDASVILNKADVELDSACSSISNDVLNAAGMSECTQGERNTVSAFFQMAAPAVDGEPSDIGSLSVKEVIERAESFFGGHTSCENMLAEYFMGPTSARKRIKKVYSEAKGLDGEISAWMENTDNQQGMSYRYIGRDTLYSLVIDRQISTGAEVYTRVNDTYTLYADGKYIAKIDKQYTDSTNYVPAGDISVYPAPGWYTNWRSAVTNWDQRKLCVNDRLLYNRRYGTKFPNALDVEFMPQADARRNILGGNRFLKSKTHFLSFCPQLNINMTVKRCFVQFAKYEGPSWKHAIFPYVKLDNGDIQYIGKEEAAKLFDGVKQYDAVLNKLTTGEIDLTGERGANACDAAYLKYTIQRNAEYISGYYSGVPPMPGIDSSIKLSDTTGTGDYAGSLESYVDFTQATYAEDMKAYTTPNYGNKNDALYTSELKSDADRNADKVKVTKIDGALLLTEANIVLPELHQMALSKAWFDANSDYDYEFARKVKMVETLRYKYGVSATTDVTYIRTTDNPTHFKIIGSYFPVNNDGITYLTDEERAAQPVYELDMARLGWPVSAVPYQNAPLLDEQSDDPQYLLNNISYLTPEGVQHIDGFEQDNNSNVMLNASMPLYYASRCIMTDQGAKFLKEGDKEYATTPFRYVFKNGSAQLINLKDETEYSKSFYSRGIATNRAYSPDAEPLNEFYMYTKNRFSGDYYCQSNGYGEPLGVNMGNIAHPYLIVETYVATPYEKIPLDKAQTIVKGNIVKANYCCRTFYDDARLNSLTGIHPGVDYNELYNYYMPNADKANDIIPPGAVNPPTSTSEEVSYLTTETYKKIYDARLERQLIEVGVTDPDIIEANKMSGYDSYKCIGDMLDYVRATEALKDEYRFYEVGGSDLFANANDRIDECYSMTPANNKLFNSAETITDSTRFAFCFENPILADPDKKDDFASYILVKDALYRIIGVDNIGTDCDYFFDNVSSPKAYTKLKEYDETVPGNNTNNYTLNGFNYKVVTLYSNRKETEIPGAKPSYGDTDKHYHCVYEISGVSTTDTTITFKDIVELYITDTGIMTLNSCGIGKYAYIGKDGGMVDSSDYSKVYDIVFANPLNLLSIWRSKKYLYTSMDGISLQKSDRLTKSTKYKPVATAATNGVTLSFTARLKVNEEKRNVLFDSPAVRISVTGEADGHIEFFPVEAHQTKHSLCIFTRSSTTPMCVLDFYAGPVRKEPVSYVFVFSRPLDWGNVRVRIYVNGFITDADSTPLPRLNEIRERDPSKTCRERKTPFLVVDKWVYRTNSAYYCTKLTVKCNDTECLCIDQVYQNGYNLKYNGNITGVDFEKYNTLVLNNIGYLLINGTLGGYTERQPNGLPVEPSQYYYTGAAFYNYALYSEALDVSQVSNLVKNLRKINFSTNGLIGLFTPQTVDTYASLWYNSAACLPVEEYDPETEDILTIEKAAGGLDIPVMYATNGTYLSQFYGGEEAGKYGLGSVPLDNGVQLSGNAKTIIRYPGRIFDTDSNNSYEREYTFVMRVDLTSGLFTKPVDLVEIFDKTHNHSVCVSVEEVSNDCITIATTTLLNGSIVMQGPILTKIKTPNPMAGTLYLIMTDNSFNFKVEAKVYNNFIEKNSTDAGCIAGQRDNNTYTCDASIPSRNRTYKDFNNNYRTEKIECPYETFRETPVFYGPALAPVMVPDTEIRFVIGSGIHHNCMVNRLLGEGANNDTPYNVYTEENKDMKALEENSIPLGTYNPVRTIKGVMIYNRTLKTEELDSCLRYLSTL